MCPSDTATVSFTNQVGRKISAGPVHVNSTVTPEATVMTSPLIPACMNQTHSKVSFYTDIQLKFVELHYLYLQVQFLTRQLSKSDKKKQTNKLVWPVILKILAIIPTFMTHFMKEKCQLQI